jgi:hypothetical protein
MPHRVWTHCCGESGSIIQLGAEVCSDCKRRGNFDGWQYSMIEAMGAYQQRTGLKPIGPHRQLADEHLKGFFELCRACGGRGLLDGGARWRTCPECQGTTSFLVGDPLTLVHVRRQILDAFPDADAGGAEIHRSEKEGRQSK